MSDPEEPQESPPPRRRVRPKTPWYEQNWVQIVTLIVGLGALGRVPGEFQRGNQPRAWFTLTCGVLMVGSFASHVSRK